MRKVIVTVVVALALGGACGDDDDQAADVEAFCTDFHTGAQLTAGGFATTAGVTDALAFFQQLEPNAPDEIDDQVSTVIDELESLSEALADVQAVEGEEITSAVQDAADVDLDELARAAAEVEEYAVQNCEDLEVGEE